MPFFSVIIPTRERHFTLKAAIQSALNQTHPDFELVVMDNFSSPATAETVEPFLSDRRTRYFRAPERLSMTDNWELALSKATGDYIFIMGDDDGLMPDGLELGRQLIEHYQTDLVAWFRYQYWWSNAIVPWMRDRLYLHLGQQAEFLPSRPMLAAFYQNQVIFENLPMVYNAFVSRALIERIKSIHGRYFMSHCPDVFSGIVNAYHSESYLYLSRALSIAGISGASTGTSQSHSSFSLKPMEDFIQDAKKDVLRELHPDLIPSANQEVIVADCQLCAKANFFPDDEEISLNIPSLLRLMASRINRDPGGYDRVHQEIVTLAEKHAISLAEIAIPERLSFEPQPFQGPVYDADGKLSTLVIDCARANCNDVAMAAQLARSILPDGRALTVSPESLRFAPRSPQADSSPTPTECALQQPRIAIDGIFFQYFQTGIARVWESLFREWAGSDVAAHVLILDRGHTAPRVPGLAYRAIAPHSYSDPAAEARYLQQVCDEEAIALFVSTYYTAPETTPSVFMAYDMIPEVAQADLSEPMWQQKHAGIRHAARYIAISDNTARDLQRFFPEIDPEQITVAPCGVSASFCPAAAEEVQNFCYRYGIQKPYFLLVAPNTGYKNAQLFFQAWSQFTARSGFDIICTGRGSYLDENLRQGAAGTMVHLLPLNDAEMRLAYSGAIALVYPSQYEGFGLPVLEAMACGCPVITTPNASLPEVAGEAAIYVGDRDVAGLLDALCEVQKPSVRQQLIQKGLQRAQQFSWSKMAAQVAEALFAATLLDLNLQALNVIAFPDWEQPEAELAEELGAAMQQLATQTDQPTTLLLANVQLEPEAANLLLSGIVMAALWSDDLPAAANLAVAVVNPLSPWQLRVLRPRLAGRWPLARENAAAIAPFDAQSLPLVSFNV